MKIASRFAKQLRVVASLPLTILLCSSTAFASPIAAGVWSQMPQPDSNISKFWDGKSWDCPTCGVGYLLAGLTGLDGLEYLNDGSGAPAAFRFDQPASAPAVVFGITAWTNGVLTWEPNGSFSYNSGTGRLSNSWDSPQQYALFRRVGAEMTRYFMGIEDILLTETLNDRDYNDYGVTFAVPNPVPEPSTLLLLGTALAGAGIRKLRARR